MSISFEIEIAIEFLQLPSGHLFLFLKLVNDKYQDSNRSLKSKVFRIKPKPLKSRHQNLRIKKTFADTPNVCTYYDMKKVTTFVPRPYEYRIRQDAHRRPATQITPRLRRQRKGFDNYVIFL